MNKREYKYYNFDKYKYYINLESFGLALDYVKNAIKNSDKSCNDCEQMELIDRLIEALQNKNINLFKNKISKNELRNILNAELYNTKSNFGESLKTREHLHNDMLKGDSVVVDGFSDGFFSDVVVKGDALMLITRMKGFGTKEAYDKFVGLEKDNDKSLEELTKETIKNNSKFEEVVNKLIKNDVSYTDFQIMIEMFIKRNMEMNIRKETVSKLLAKGFNSMASKFVHVIGNVLTNEDVEWVSDVNPRILFNMGVAKKIVKERNKLKKRELYISKIEEKKMKEAQLLKKKSESEKLLTSEQHCAAINDQVRNLTKLVCERKRNFFKLSPEEMIYEFDVVDFLMANRYSFKTLNSIIKEKIDYCEKDPVHKFYVAKLEQSLKFLTLAEKYSTTQPVEQSFSYFINGAVREVADEEIEVAKDYLKSNNVAINSYTMSSVLRRMILGGNINSKYEKNCLQIKKNVENKDDIPTQ